MARPFHLICIDDVDEDYERYFWTRIGARRIGQWFVSTFRYGSGCYVWYTGGDDDVPLESLP